MRRSTLVILFMAFVAGLGCVSAPGAQQPGGGGSVQTAPDSVRAGELIVITLELSVWGAGGPIAGRYTDISLHYRLVGHDRYAVVRPTIIAQQEKRETYRFTIPPYPSGVSGRLEYHLELTLDGYHRRTQGIKTIELRAAPGSG